jgi:hypothetical protein
VLSSVLGLQLFPGIAGNRGLWHSTSAEVEYMVASQAACEAIWMRKILVGLFSQEMDPTMIYCDNQSCIKLSENPVFHDRSKHIDIRYHQRQDWGEG